jgi:ubiquinone/menaquinone biosynthesis C-methylase UbiE
MSQSSQNAYQTTPVDYLTQITRLFGDYKKRAFAFLELQPGEHLLDAGCGAGDDLLAAAAMLQGAVSLHGVDLDPETLKAAKARAQAAGVEIDFQQGDLSQLPFADDQMDVVRSDRVFQHLTRPGAVLAEMIRVTRPGGRIVGIDVDWGTLVLDHPMTELSDRLCAFARDHHTNGRSGRQMRQWFLDAGLEDVHGYADAVCVDNWQIATYVFGLRALLDQFVSVGGTTAAEASEWWQLSENQAEQGLFFSSMTGFVMRGRVAK